MLFSGSGTDMVIRSLRLKNYRNYDNLNINFNDNLNIIIGDNAQGKTNLLESIYVLAVTKSFLSNNDKSIIKFNNHYTKINGLIEGKYNVNTLELLINDNGKCVKINNKEIKKLSDYISNMNVIIFSSNDIVIFKDSPSSRRKYFNIQISQINKNYLRYLNDYNVILRQRNEFLKILDIKKENDIKYFDILTDKYVDLATDISRYRNKYINDINSYLDDIFRFITGMSGLSINYISNINYSDDFDKNILKKKIKDNFDREIQYKTTLLGPNRDDFVFMLNGKNLSSFGSQGQIRSAVLSLKLAEVKLFYEMTNDEPILLLDDIFSELDIRKRNNVLKYLNNDIQTIITTTDIENIDKTIREKANVYNIENFPGNNLMQEGDRK